MKNKIKLLILEDDQEDIILLKEMIADEDSIEPDNQEFDAVFLTSLKEGIDFILENKVDVILLDLSLPDSFRLDTLKNLTRNGTSGDIPVIVLTALDDKETGIEAVKMGAQEYLVKGQITPDLLFKAIRYAIERHLLKSRLKNETIELKQSEDHLIKIITSDPDGVVILDTLHIVRFINPAAEKLLDRTRKYYLGKPFEYSFPRNEFVSSEIEIIRKKETVILEVRSVSIDFQGDRAWLISLRDISLKKRLLNAFSEEKERLDITLRSIGDGVIAADELGNISIINNVAMEIIGLPMEAIVGKPLDDVLILKNKSTGLLLKNPSAKIMKTGKLIDSIGLIDWVLVSGNGEEIPVEFSGAPVRKQKEVMGVVWVICDVSEKKELEEEAIRGQNLEALGVLAGGIAHEYNNILTSTLGYISLAKNSLRSESRILGRLKKVEQAALRAKEISSRLLTFSKGGEPRKKIESIIPTLKAASLIITRFPGVKILWQIEDATWRANFDPEQVELAVKNILRNSIEAMPEGGEILVKVENLRVPEIKFSNIRRGNYIKISISDQGTGVPCDFLKKVFAPYFSTKQNAEGMGLTTAYSIIRKHGGWIRMKSRGVPGEGSIVTILLPIATLGNDTDESKSDIQKLGSINPIKGKVMVMDDEPYIREVASELLETLCYEAVVAESGEEALILYREALKTNNLFFAVILDLVIPSGMGGKECIRKLLELDPNVNAIVSSGYSNDPVMANYKDYGFKGVLPKPYQLDDLEATLENLK